jgi:hypothetical protein
MNDCGGFVALTTRHHLTAKVDTNFADKRRSLGPYSLRLRTQAREFVCLFFCLKIQCNFSQRALHVLEQVAALFANVTLRKRQGLTRHINQVPLKVKDMQQAIKPFN